MILLLPCSFAKSVAVWPCCDENKIECNQLTILAKIDLLEQLSVTMTKTKQFFFSLDFKTMLTKH